MLSYHNTRPSAVVFLTTLAVGVAAAIVAMLVAARILLSLGIPADGVGVVGIAVWTIAWASLTTRAAEPWVSRITARFSRRRR